MKVIIPMDKKAAKAAYDKVYKKANKERIARIQKIWRENNKERVKEYSKRYYERYKQEHGTYYSKEWAQNNQEKVAKTKRNFRDKHYEEPKYWISEKISYWRSKYPEVKSDLTTEYLLNIWNEQDGKCYYTGEPMIFGARQGKAIPNSASLDRLIPELGYVKGNVVWCTFFCNTM